MVGEGTGLIGETKYEKFATIGEDLFRELVKFSNKRIISWHFTAKDLLMAIILGRNEKTDLKRRGW